MMNVLVTGGAGFIGSHIVEGMVKRGIRTRVLDDFSTGSRENLEGIEGIEVIEADIRDYDALRTAMDGIEIVFHHAALASVSASVKDPVRSNSVNLDGTVKVLSAAKDAGVKKVVYAGSSSAYGDTPAQPKVESMREQPISPYAVNKTAGEKYCNVFSRIYGLETVVLRYFNVFGPRQDPLSHYSGVISLFIQKLLDGQRPIIYGDGEQTRDFVYVGNVVMANIFASVSRIGGGEVFNVATGEKVTINRLLEIIMELLEIENVKPIYREHRKGDLKHSLADIGKAQQAFGYWPVIGLREGLKKTIDWYRNLKANQKD
jgi:nucleoside-diphosphate-sugar epimerase